MRRASTIEQPGRFEIVEAEERTPQPGEVQVRVRNCGICGSDLHALHRPQGWTAGRTPGHEIAGEVVAVGDGDEGLRAGDPVRAGDRVCVEPLLYCGACEYCLAGSYQLCPQRTLLGVGAPGGFAEFVTVPARIVYRLPDGVGFALGALAEPLAVAVHGLRTAASISEGVAPGRERVAVLGAGTIGLLAAFYARQSGAMEVAITARHSPAG